MYRFILVFMFLLCVVVFNSQQVAANTDTGGEKKSPECKGWYAKAPKSTVCLKDSPFVLESGVTDEEKKLVVDLHNDLRSKVEPLATNMMKMVWDDQIAAVAEKWAKQCKVAHDKNRRVPDYWHHIGQNAAGGQGNWKGAVMAWYNEVRMYEYGEDPEEYLGEGGWKKIGHYSQVATAKSYLLGCGFAKCSNSYKRFYICNYGPGQFGVRTPYKTSDEEDRCSDCPNSCNNGLCDCKDRKCKHGGKLDIDKCTCKCPSIYSGENCETLKCPERDHLDCWYNHSPKSCSKWISVKSKCPFMCGICGGPGPVKPPPTVLTPFNCSYTGYQAPKDECAKYGNKGQDSWACQSMGGKNFGCNACRKFSNVKRQYCPVMCGICPAPCKGKKCENHRGSLDTETCKCKCKTPYSGELCEKVTCPIKDAWYCGKRWPAENCDENRNYPRKCPYMCGLCKEGDGPCKGLRCKNKGRLDVDTCKCKCKDPFKGTTCEEVTCPKKDKFYCGSQWPPSYCKKFAAALKACPYMCGLCHSK